MRISFSLLFILVLFTACGPGKGRIRIEGKLKHLDKAECYLYAEGGDFSKPDTITISGGKFKLEKELPEACLLTILYPNATTTTFIGEPGATIKIDGDAGRLDEVDISGSELNERLTKFRQRQVKKTKSDQLMAATQYIRDHAKSLDGLALYYKYYVDNDATDATVALELLNLLRKGLPQSKALVTLDAALRPWGAHSPIFLCRRSPENPSRGPRSPESPPCFSGAADGAARVRPRSAKRNACRRHTPTG